MPLSIPSTSSAATVTFMQQALFGSAAANAVYSTGVSEVASGGASAYAISLGNNFSSSDSALSTTVLTNLGITSTSIAAASYNAIQSALTLAFAAHPTARGQVVLNLSKILSNLEGDATYGTAATAFNTAIVSNVSYSSSTTNTSARAVDPAAAPAGQTFTLTTSADSSGVLIGSLGTTSTTGDDIFIGIVDGGGTTDTLTAADTINGGSGTADTLNITAIGTTIADVTQGANITGIEVISVRNTVATGVIMGLSATGLTGVTMLGIGDTTVTNMATGVALSTSSTGAAILSQGYAAAATSAVTNIAGGSALGTVTYVGAGLTGVTINTTGTTASTAGS